MRVSKTGRSLSITGTDSDRTSLDLNMWLDRAFQLPGSMQRNYLRALNRAIEKAKAEVVFPQPDSEVGRISEERERVRARLFLPDVQTVSSCLDKFAALSIWHNAGLRQEATIISWKDARKPKLPRLDYPRWIRAREGAGGLLSCLAKDDNIVHHWTRFHWEQGIKTDFVAEEYLPGRDFCFMSIWNQGNLVTSMIRERLSWVGHRLIGTGGTSRLNRVVHSDLVNKTALASITAIARNPHGVFCVDLKEDQNGNPRPTEINCRFTTNVHYLALASLKLGHPEWNFPWLASQLALGEDIPRCTKIDALPEDLWFTKNTDMGFTMIRGNQWRAGELGAF